MKKLRVRLRRATRKLARAVRGLQIAERRIKHHSARAKHAHLTGKYWEKRNPTKARRAHHRAFVAKNRASWWRQRRNRQLRRRAFLRDVVNRRARRKKAWLKKHRPPATGEGGLETFDGKQVAAGFSYWLTKSRAAGWKGYVVSGYRSPAYSQSLCYAMCGAPSCPGRCAGTSSNHSKATLSAGGAVDLTDYYTFERIQPQIGSPLINRLGSRDPVHFSISGV